MQRSGDGVARRLRDRFAHERLQRVAVDPVHREDASRREGAVHARHEHLRHHGRVAAIAIEVARLALVVGLEAQLALRLGGDRVDVERHGQEVQSSQQRREVVDVAVHAARHARKLDLQRELAPTVLPGAVYLADGRSGDRLHVEARELPLPALAVFAAEHAPQLRIGHRVALRAQHAERIAELGRDDLVALQRQHLPDLHRRPAQRRQPARERFRITRSQYCREEVRPLAARELLRRSHRGGQRQLAAQHAEAQQPPDPRCRHRAALPRALGGH